MDPRKRNPPTNFKEKGPLYDRSLEKYVPTDLYSTLELHNNELEQLNVNLHNLIKKCEDSTFLRRICASSDEIKSKTIDIKKTTKEIENETLKVYKELNLDEFFDSPIEKNINVNESRLSKNQSKTLSKNLSEGVEIEEKAPVRKKAKSSKSVNRGKVFEISVTQPEKKNKKPRSLIPIVKANLLLGRNNSSFSLSGTLFSKKDVERFTKTVANERILQQEVIPTQARGPGDIDPSNIKYETDSDTRLTRSRREKQKKYKDISFYHKLHAQIWQLYYLPEEDIRCGIIETNIEEDLSAYYFN